MSIAISKVSVMNNGDQQEKVYKKNLKHQIDICPNVLSKIESCVQGVLEYDRNGIRYLKTGQHRRIFILKNFPGLIFKMNIKENDTSMDKRHQNTLEAARIVHDCKLNSLFIPKQRLTTFNIRGKEYHVILEQKLKFDESEEVQQRLFQIYVDDEVVRQFFHLVFKLHYSDVRYGNNPVCYVRKKYRVAFTDLEEVESAAVGLFGAFNREGLVSCVSEKQGMQIFQMAERNSVNTSSFNRAWSLRKDKLLEQEKLKKYYEERKIVVGDEPIQIEPSKLLFPSHPREAERLRKIAFNLVQEINERLSENSWEGGIRNRRTVYVGAACGKFGGLDTELVSCEEDTKMTAEVPFCNTFFGQVMDTLKKVGAIYGYRSSPAHGYFIQA